MLAVPRASFVALLCLGLIGCSQQPPAPPPQPGPVTAAPAVDPPAAAPAVDPPMATPAVDPSVAGDSTERDPFAAESAPSATAPRIAPATPAKAAAAAETPAEDVPDTSAKVREVVSQMAEFYKGVKSFKVTATLSQKVEGADDLGIGGSEARRTFVFERPNRGVFRHLSDAAADGSKPEDVAFAAVSNGETLTLFVAELSQYVQQPAPGTLAELKESSIAFQGLSGFPLSLGADDPAQSLMEGAETMRYVGQETLDEQPMHRVSFSQPGGQGGEMKTDVWIAAEGQPLVMQVVIDAGKQAIPLRDGTRREIHMSITDKLTGWEIDPTLSDDAFAFTAPEGARLVKNLGEPEPSPLLGKAAPPIDLELVTEGRLNLADHAGKNVVLLDFWATWCGPCIREMPVLAKVAAEYADRGVMLYAVNLEEEAADIEAFLKDNELSVTVALDKDGAMATAYGAEGIPHLVIVDKQGVVQAVHTGFSETLEQTLKEELDSILAGKNLYEAPAGDNAEAPDADAAPQEGAAADAANPADAPKD